MITLKIECVYNMLSWVEILIIILLHRVYNLKNLCVYIILFF